ncbi:helix-turn-helix transcriptional regulator [Spongiibacter sp. KMU-166]|uniref:Helix-turn-helix transcriptional regulator n=1 Tax=Spongiibacter thalassae TaxID=2721624 RepID=A0ABX1GBW4_9GAMM|nr:helix-turn-helix domain-containing protein [Spongiibacter thalassae]NKI15897.1 helix-turn-helix transcriptional regulator [Spongiibacter thalassae]
MPKSLNAAAKESLPFGRLLRFWRETFELSQEQLALAVDSSTRHINRLENSHVHPSLDMVGKIIETLSLRERDGNYLLLAAGYRPQVRKMDFKSPNLKWLRKAMILSLKALNPYPSMLMDGACNVLMVNRAWLGLFQQSIPDEKLKNINNYIDLFFEYMATEVDSEDWADAQALMAMWLQQEVILNNEDESRRRLTRVTSLPQVPENWKRRAASVDPLASFRVKLEFNGQPTYFYSVVQTVGSVGTAAYVSEPRLSICTYYPVDDIDISSLVENDLAHPLLQEL